MHHEFHSIKFKISLNKQTQIFYVCLNGDPANNLQTTHHDTKRETMSNLYMSSKLWYMAKGHERTSLLKKGGPLIGFAVAAPWTNLHQGIVSGIVLGWALIVLQR